MKVLIILILMLSFSVPASADLIIESTSVINTEVKGAWGPAWSPDGNSIAYISYDNSRNQQLFVINVDGTGKKQVTNDTIKKWSIEWVNEEISFLSYDTDGLEKIFLIKPDGTGRRKLLSDNKRQGRAAEDKPPFLGGTSWSPENKKILFTSMDEMANEKIYEINVDGTGKKLVITDEFRQWNPRWSPDGNAFVYVSYDSRLKEQLFIANKDGTGKTQITFDDIKKSDPYWGKDGILFVSYETVLSSGGQIYIINPDGTGKRLLIKEGFKQRNPRWSRDGYKILYEDIDIQGNLTFRVLNLQKPAVTPVITPTPTAAPTLTPVPTTPAETPVVEETPSALKEVVYSMLMVVAIIVVVMLVILAISSILGRKK